MQYISGEARKPSIFVSSTCYDLKQIRQDIREFIEADLGYEAILSEYDSFPIDSDKDTINNCLRVVEQRADQPAKEIEKSKVPAALARALKMHPEVKTIVLHLDNDRIGRLATKAIFTVLPKQYQVKDVPPKQGKDYNDLLCIKLNLAITKREKSTKKSMSGHENMRDRR